MNIPSLIKLTPTLQHYPWGYKGSESLVGLLGGISDSPLPCAELWVGAHPKSPSFVNQQEKTLSLLDLLNEAKRNILGEDDELHFLLKVLAVREALSIQLHPSPSEAPLLHAQDAKNYPDAKAKPEMAYALSEVTLLYGLLPVGETASLVLQHSFAHTLFPSLRGGNSSQKQLWNELFTANEKILKESIQVLQQEKEYSLQSARAASLATARGQNDPGVFAPFLMEEVVLPPGSALFIAPHIPHAYLSGTLIECLANSDNVVRAGLTDKYLDVHTLLRLLPDTPVSARTALLSPSCPKPEIYSFKTPGWDVTLDIMLGYRTWRDIPSQGVELILCVFGEAVVETTTEVVSLRKGEALCIPASTQQYSLLLRDGLLARSYISRDNCCS